METKAVQNLEMEIMLNVNEKLYAAGRISKVMYDYAKANIIKKYYVH